MHVLRLVHVLVCFGMYVLFVLLLCSVHVHIDVLL